MLSSKQFKIFLQQSGLENKVDQIIQATQKGQLNQVQALLKIKQIINQVKLSSKQLQIIFEETENVKKSDNFENDQVITIHTPSQLPQPTLIEKILEPWIRLEILTPEEYVGRIIELIATRRGSYDRLNLLSSGQIQLVGKLPLAEMIIDFYDELKSISKGFATMSYDLIGFEMTDLVKIDILVNHKVVDPLSIIVHRSQSEIKGRQICEKLSQLIPRQQIEVIIQAAIGSRILARETIKPFRKDVTAKLYGGDITRRMKLLDKQKAGKKRMKMVGNVEIPQTAFLNVLKK